jgi:hypothetical protein
MDAPLLTHFCVTILGNRPLELPRIERQRSPLQLSSKSLVRFLRAKEGPIRTISPSQKREVVAYLLGTFDHAARSREA